MAESSIKYQCGCGFITDNPIEAAVHADLKGHILTVLGRVQPDKKEKKNGT